MQPLKQIENLALKENLFSSKKSLLYDEIEGLDLKTDLAQNIMESSKAMAEKFEKLSRKEQVFLTKRRNEISKTQSYGKGL